VGITGIKKRAGTRFVIDVGTFVLGQQQLIKGALKEPAQTIKDSWSSLKQISPSYLHNRSKKGKLQGAGKGPPPVLRALVWKPEELTFRSKGEMAIFSKLLLGKRYLPTKTGCDF